ncbi:MAG: PAS domain-containing sensor histidine kinase [Thaumarchaeota archaeon]|jgi:PAS domain S-box-containing protein|nr:PAS domain-containing sensor histidine kinase [Nitrososphaerota archaeon]MBT5843041.1 PAS domain-containing sensor histidine kinase [Nitrososphaerota archaeon]
MKTISALKKLNLNISEFEELLFDHSIVGITDEEGTIIYANKNFCKISKYTADELLGNNHRMIKSDHHDNEFFSKMWTTISAGKVWEGEVKNKAKDGTFYWVKTVIIPITDDDGIKNYVAIRTDVTKEKEIQQKLLKIEDDLQKQNVTLLSEVEKKSIDLVKSERLATIGTMASRIAHDLKNPLTIIQTYAEMLSPEILSKLESVDKEKWFRLQNSVFDMKRIIEDVLDFARTTEIKKKKTSFMSILRLAMNHVKSTYGIQINLPENDVSLKCDSRKIEGVLSNLINNAVQAIDGHGEIDVEVSSDSENLTILVKDSGSGIPDGDLEKVFEPMFTTKKTGTGLGLVICKSIVEQHGGNISASNKPTTFTVVLPIK